MRIAIFVTNDGASYGGGRLASLLLAHCLARAGCDVCYVTNAKPVFYDELETFSHPSSISLYLSKDFHDGVPKGDFDIVILIPTQAINILFYAGARGFARRRNARLSLFNFESPNWFNMFAPVKRDESLWAEWRLATEDGCLILSNSRESMKYAQSYYVDHPHQTFFDYWHQPINVLALKNVSPQLRENRIVGFVRATDPHKGGQDVLDALSPDLAGFTLALIVGGKKLDPGFETRVNEVTQRFDISLEVRTLVSEAEKFVELKRARLLLYPSRFEGYGIPPIEALACGTPCVCYDLPVLHEVCESSIHYAPLGDIEGLRRSIREAIAMPNDELLALPDRVKSVLDVEICGIAARTALEKYLASGLKIAPANTSGSQSARFEIDRLSFSKVRLDPAGHIEVEGRYPVRDVSEIAISVDGVELGHAFKRAPDKGPADANFSFIAPLQCSAATFTVTARLIAHDGAASESISKELRVQDVTQAAPPIDNAVLRASGFRYVKEDESAFLHGWVAGADLPIGIQVYVDSQKAWVRAGRARPDVTPKIADLPPQSPGFVAHLRLPAGDPKSQADVLIAIYTAKGSYAFRTKVKPQPVAPSGPDAGVGSAKRGPLHSLPLVSKVRRVSIDEFRVVEFEGYILARPRIDVMRFYVDDEFLGEGISDRLAINVFEKNRAYGDVYCGFMFVGRTRKAPNADSRWRIELLYGDEVVETLDGAPSFTERAEADYKADISLLPAGPIEKSTSKVVLFITSDPTVAQGWPGAERRALITELRASGRHVIAVLHGNPHAFREQSELWLQLVDGVLVVNPLSPTEHMNGREDRPNRKLRRVLENLASSGTVEALVMDGFDFAAAVQDIDPKIRRIVLDDGKTAVDKSRLPNASSSQVITTSSERLAALSKALPQAQILMWAIQGKRLEEELELWPAQPIPETASSWYFLDATADLKKFNSAAFKRASKAVAAINPRAELGVIIDMPPLLPDAEIRRRLGISDNVALLWPGVLHAIGAGVDANLILLGTSLSTVALAAMSKGAPLFSLSTKGSLTPYPNESLVQPGISMLDLLPIAGTVQARNSLPPPQALHTPAADLLGVEE